MLLFSFVQLVILNSIRNFIQLDEVINNWDGFEEDSQITAKKIVFR